MSPCNRAIRHECYDVVFFDIGLLARIPIKVDRSIWHVNYVERAPTGEQMAPLDATPT
ncbi:hypothetical protein MMEU_4766 [Mycobacterium marinum str. Europe]|nr:hypothetical protein MMEU_4766 [Mycobacterium marinum str. Europe]